jgi:hypothetical protein
MAVHGEGDHLVDALVEGDDGAVEVVDRIWCEAPAGVGAGRSSG